MNVLNPGKGHEVLAGGESVIAGKHIKKTSIVLILTGH